MLAANPAKPGFSEDSFNQASAVGDQSKRPSRSLSLVE
jgi:hypothetical protein